MEKLYTLTIVLLVAFSANSQIINIPDPVFKNLLVNTNCCGIVSDHDVDTNNDGEIDVSEAAAETYIGGIIGTNITSFEGIQYFTNLIHLYSPGSAVTTLDLSNSPALTTLVLNDGQLTNLVLPAAANLVWLDVSNNLLTSLDFGSSTIHNIDCSDNQLTSVDVSEVTLSDHMEIWFRNNLLTELEFNQASNNGFFYILSISNNPLTTFKTPAGGDTFSGVNNALTSVDFSSGGFNDYYLSSSNLQYINFKNGVFDGSGEIFNVNLPSLQSICVDSEAEGVYLESLIGTPNILYSTYCTFEPGGDFNTITGNVTLDCAGGNIALPNVPLLIEDNTIVDEYTYTGNSGNYLIYANEGNLTVTPQFENAAYFTISPPNFTYTFQSNGGETQTANFCVSANGVHPDLDVTLLPIEAARPGFDAIYKIVYKNKGNQTQSGNITFTFDDATLDFIVANPTESTVNVNSLSWDFTNLAPFESREITFTLNVNSPMETPPVNNNDILTFSASANSGSDETPDDNIADLNQIVVGSFDPNDKAVSEGSQIDITNIDNYLHYVIRFQNTGTFAAENVVVKDILSTQLDPSTLQIVSASHAYRSTVTDGNKLEFFFENINLPDSTTDEAGSHGYIAFKIKPTTTVGLGSILENTAEIYFDFNFPIVTNTVSTTVTTLGSQQFDVKDGAIIYPNPVENILNIELKSAAITSINIYNTLGQMIKSVEDLNIQGKTALPVDELTSGAYLIEIISDKGKSIKKLIKL